MSRSWRAAICAAWLVLAALVVAPGSSAHGLDSASLSLYEVSAGRFLVKWQASSESVQGLPSLAVFPEPCRLEAAHLDCGAAGLAGTIELPWLEGTLTHVMVDIAWLNRTRLLRTVTASSPRLAVYGPTSSSGLRALRPIAVDYGWLGIEHISTGFDHLLFVVALTLLIRRGRALLATITAFTLGHSLSLSASVLGYVNVPAPPVEAAIALSIVLVCAEALRAGDSLTVRAPWLVALAFGLLHGLGFASALLEIGLPEQHVPLALAFFNVGVELGQLAVIVLVGTLGWLSGRLGPRQAWLRPTMFYAIGSVAACWSFERVTAVFGR